MKYTSAEANKLVTKLGDELQVLSAAEYAGKEFLAAVNEDVESARPDYSFAATQAKRAELEEKVRKVKHAINVFNTTTVIPEIGVTVDEALVLIPQLNRRARELFDMLQRLPKVREQSANKIPGVIDYRYINYDLSEVRKAHRETTERLYKVQMALDAVNTTLTFEIDV